MGLFLAEIVFEGEGNINNHLAIALDSKDLDQEYWQLEGSPKEALGDLTWTDVCRPEHREADTQCELGVCGLCLHSFPMSQSLCKGPLNICTLLQALDLMSLYYFSFSLSRT